MQKELNAKEAAHAREVQEMFSGIAPKYDLLNHVLSLNVDKAWRRRVRERLADVLLRDEALVLDLACGTGDLSLELSRETKARVIGTDFCRPMLTVAVQKTGDARQKVPYVEGDAMRLAYADDTFDAVTIAFGLRNLANWEGGLSEIHRVLKPGGTIAVLEFSDPVIPGFRQLFNFYFAHVLPRIGGAVSGSRGAYEYLPDSVKRFPAQRPLKELMERTGFSGVIYQNLTAGIAALHSGTKTI